MLSAEPRLRGGQTAFKDEILYLESKVGRRIGVIRATGDPVEQLSEAARSQGASLLVTGGRGPSRAGVTESVSARLAHRADCSVLIVR
jgi:nucleotide-binding universal stress UspA family protein